MRKDKFIAFRAEDNQLDFIRDECKKANKTMSELIREGIDKLKKKKS